MHTPATRHQLSVILTFSYAYLTVAAGVILWRRNFEFLLYLAVMAVIIAAVLAVYRRAGLSRPLLWGFSIWGIMHMVGGLMPIPDHWHTADTTGVVYNWLIVPIYVKYDQIVHAYGVGLVTWLTWQALSTRVCSLGGAPLRPTLGMVAVCATTGMGFGALNEVIEFFAVMILPKTNVGDYENTGWDLVANFVGAVITASTIHMIAHWRFRKHDAGMEKT